MQIDPIKEDGLRREYKVVYAAEEVDSKVDEKLSEVGQRIRMPGFRPGKAPLSLLKKLHGKAVLGEVIDELVQEGSNSVINDQQLKPALQPNVEILAFDDGSDLEFKLDVEILPEVQIPDFSKINLERLKVEPDAADVEAALERLAADHKHFDDAPKERAAESGDVVVIDFEGKIGGEVFEGGTAQGHRLELGSGAFIPGFEDQLAGVKAGDEKKVEVTFPDEYHAADLAGKKARFDVAVQKVMTPVQAGIDDRLAKELGFSDLEALKDRIGEQLAGESESMSRAILKRRLLDSLAEKVDFEIPRGMVDLEYKQIWEQIKMDAISSGEATLEELKDVEEPKDEAEREEFRAIAERRVRLGLLLSEVGTQNDVQVSGAEVNRRLVAEAQRYPGQEKEVLDYYKNNENAMAAIRAPIFEDKVCDLILDTAQVTEKKVSRAELQAAVEALEKSDSPTAEAAPSKKSKAQGKKRKQKAKAKSRAEGDGG